MRKGHRTPLTQLEKSEEGKTVSLLAIMDEQKLPAASADDETANDVSDGDSTTGESAVPGDGEQEEEVETSTVGEGEAEEKMARIAQLKSPKSATKMARRRFSP